jgi:hypothetical protein
MSKKDKYSGSLLGVPPPTTEPKVAVDDKESLKQAKESTINPIEKGIQELKATTEEVVEEAPAEEVVEEAPAEAVVEEVPAE